MSQGKPRDWKHIKGILDRALDQDPARRREFVEHACPDEGLKRHVLSMLDAYESETAEFPPPPGRPVDESTLGLEAEPELYAPGATIGPYRIEKKLGAGGMGTVFLARRSDESFDKKVAIKVVQRRWASPEELARFRSERQILADLSHPSIAQLLDGGNTPEGRPFLVMEYVEGMPIDAYCRSHNPSLDVRLDLFQQVCSAVQFAHQNLIVHRDLKPANILVSAEGQVKLLDFGIAKVLEPKDFAMTVMETRPGSSPMTLAYASPEQVRGRNVTTATDVYSLGLLLYEMLTGRRPYELQHFNLIDAVEAICRRDVQAPSTVLRRTRLDDDSGSPAPTHTAAWRRIQGDLDAIVLKALAKEPHERYAGAGQMAEDLERFRNSEPVRARQGTWLYRSQKFLVRHRMPLAALATILAILVGSIFVLVRQQIELRRQRDQAETVSSWMTRIFESPDPRRSRGETVTARSLLNKSRESIGEDLAGEPRLQSRLLQVLARTYANLGLFDDAAELADAAYDIALPFDDRPELLRLLALRTHIAFRRNQHRNAIEIAEKAVDLGPTVAARAPEAWVELLSFESRSRLSLFQTDAAEEVVRKALAFAGPDVTAERRADLLQTLAEIQARNQHHQAAEATSRSALELLQQEEEELHPAVLKAERQYIRIALQRLGIDEAKRRLENILERHRKLNSDNLEDLAMVYQTLGLVCERSGLADEAEQHYRTVLRLGAQTWDGIHPDLITANSNLATLRMEAGDLDEAERLADEALRIAELEVGNDSYLYGIVLHLLGRIEYRKKNYVASETYHREGLKRVEPAVGPIHEHTIQFLNSLAFLALAQDRKEEAEAYFLDALERGRQAPTRPSNLSHITYYLAQLEAELDKVATAVDLMQEVVDHDGDEEYGLKARSWRSRYLVLEQRFAEAERDALHAADRWQSAGNDVWYLSSRHSLALARLGQGRAEDAVDILQSVLARRMEIGASESKLRETREDLDAARKALAASRDASRITP